MDVIAEARIAPAQAPWPPSVQARFGAITPIRLFRVLARDERLFARFMDGGFLDRGHLALRDRELAILTVSARNGSEYEWGVHVAYFAKAAGFTEAELAATCKPMAQAGWSGRDARVVRLCDVLQVSCEIEEHFWAELVSEFGEMGLLELLLLIGKYRQVCILTNALRLELEAGAPRFPT